MNSHEPKNDSNNSNRDNWKRCKTDEIQNLMMEFLLKPKLESHNLSQGVLSNPSA
jgi:hypothetical protein